jgi:signal transduction histidine kinase
MTSIQRQLIRTLIFVVSSLAALSGIIIYYYCRSRLVAQFDRGLVAETRSIAEGVLREGNGDLEFYFAEADHPEFRKKEHPDYFEIWRADGSVFRKSRSLDDNELPRIAADSSAPAVEPIASRDGANLRAAGFKVIPHLDLDDIPPRAQRSGIANDPLYLVVASNPHALNETLWTIATALVLAGVALVASITGSVIITVRRGLTPLRRLAAEADAIEADSLHQRISQDSLPIELAAVSQKFNELLARLEVAFRRERNFASAAAHELRTPIAELRALAEVALRWPDDADARQNLNDTLQIANRMEGLVRALLVIVRSDSKPQTVRLARVDLNALIHEIWRHFESRAQQRRLSFSYVPAEQMLVQTDAMMFRALLENLVSNAVAHTPAGGTVECRVEQSGDLLQLTLANACLELTAEDIPRLFEPFWRKDDSRSGGEHFGLGLSLVASYATALGVSVRVQLQSPERFKVIVGPMTIYPTVPVKI